MAFVFTPLQITWLLIGFIVGVGLTVIEKRNGEPGHDMPLFVKVGVTLIDDDNGEFIEFRATKELISPVPFDPNPI
jgi:hypothetical protein